MIDINFDSLLRTEVFISGLDQRLQNHTRLWRDFVAPFTYVRSTIFLRLKVAGGGQGWIRSTRHEKPSRIRGKGILRRDDTYMEAATSPNHPGSIAEFGPTELVLGVSGAYFESTFGANYPALHEEGNDEQNLSARPVYELIAAGERFEERITQLGEKWQREEIAVLERSV